MINKFIVLIIVLVLVLPLSGCVAYLAGVAVTSRHESEARIECIEKGGEYLDGSSWGLSSGKCIMPGDNIKIENLTQEEKCVFLGGTYSEEGNCDLSDIDDKK